MTPKSRFQESNGNVFADLGVRDPKNALAKAELARQINSMIAARKLSQSEAAGILGIDQPRVSALFKGRLALFSIEKLMDFAARLGNRVEISIRPARVGEIRVTAKIR